MGRVRGSSDIKNDSLAIQNYRNSYIKFLHAPYEFSAEDDNRLKFQRSSDAYP